MGICKKENFMRKYQGKFFSILGDSISALEGSLPEGYEAFYTGERKYESGVFGIEDIWWGKVIRALGAKLLINNSWSGSLVCRHPQCEIPSYGCSDERTSSLGGKDNPDVVMIYLGENDYGWRMQVLPKIEAEKQDLSIFRSAYAEMLRKIKKNYPDAEIWCLTMSEAVFYGQEETLKFKREGIEEYSQTIAACAKAAGARVIRLFERSRQYRLFTIDRLHPNEEGMRAISEMILSQIEE